ncbi:MAG: 2-C-methyl-D-erythritol 4-phosphate cytidylyltransferase [Bacilli bacterium]|nr:2-C-methyl-D-erythritol 4-phosphate cytidylyltransferase [Bacilli bacterium]
MNVAIILLAGKSERLNNDTSKQFIKINDKYLFEYSLSTFDSIKDIDSILLVTLKDKISFVKDIVKDRYNKIIDVISGGKNRQESIHLALEYLKQHQIDENDNILIHDSARPLVSKEVITSCLESLSIHDSITSAIKAYDTVSIVKDNKVIEILDRNYVYLHQTPQAFKFLTIYEAHSIASKSKMYDKTDDVSLIINQGKEVYIVDGDVDNFKITTESDLKRFIKMINK